MHENAAVSDVLTHCQRVTIRMLAGPDGCVARIVIVAGDLRPTALGEYARSWWRGGRWKIRNSTRRVEVGDVWLACKEYTTAPLVERLGLEAKYAALPLFALHDFLLEHGHDEIAAAIRKSNQL